MKRMRMVGLCLIAVFALTALAASTASAVTYEKPVFYTKATVGLVAPNVQFTGTIGVASLETSPAKSIIKCTKGTATGEVTGPTTTGNQFTKFEGCTLGTFNCESAGEPTGTLNTENLDGVLGQISKATGKVGERLKPHSGIYLAQFTCDGGTIPVKAKNSVIGELTGGAGGAIPPLHPGETGVEEGKFAASATLAFKQTAGKQAILNFEGEGPEQIEASLNGAAYEKSGQTASVKIVSVPGASNLGFTK